MDVRVTGAEQLERVYKAVREAGDNEIRKDMLRGLRNTTKPLIAAVRIAARDDLPSAGGLAADVAAGKYAARTRTSGQSAGVRITGVWAGHDVEALDRGVLRKPVFGNRSVWVLQSVTPGFFSRTLADKAPTVQADLLAVMEDVVQRIARRI